MDRPRRPKPQRARYLLLGVGVAVLAAATVALARLEPAPPAVERATVVIDTVKRGAMLLDVRGRGTLVPEQIRWVTAVTQGRVERIRMRPGSAVKAGDVLVELSNPDLELKALEAQRQLAQAQADLVNLRATLESERLAQESQISSLRVARSEAERRAHGDARLAGLLPPEEISISKERAAELEQRMAIEGRRLDVQAGAMSTRVSAERTQLETLRAIVAFNARLIDGMKVRAGADGVLTELPLEEGQWVTPGTLLARVVRPERLKAQLRIAETQAKDLQLGQPARIDTRNGIVPGRVARIDPASQGGTVGVDVTLEGELPKGARPDLSVDGTIELEHLPDVLYTGRPAYGQAEGAVGLYRLVGDDAVRVKVQLGRASASAVEIRSGLSLGDRVILSDMSAWDAHERVRIR